MATANTADTFHGRASVSPTAVVWITGRHAVVAVAADEVGGITSSTVERMIESEADFVARIVGAVGDSERVMVLGPGQPAPRRPAGLRGELAPSGPPRGGGAERPREPGRARGAGPGPRDVAPGHWPRRAAVGNPALATKPRVR